MGKIKQLSQEVIAKISAGQVVERPASVVKELVENSLDAKSSHIKIELELAGKKKIIVTDDGMGMEYEDLQSCFAHHTTSKIFNEDDLFCINTFGFRGEALSSVVAVANVRFESKPKNEISGKYIELVNGTVTNTGSVGMPTGTRIVVSGLFSGIPARKKYLKSDATEFSHVLHAVTALVLANPTVAFTVIHNGKTILDLPQNQTLLERLTQVLSEHISDNLLPITIESDHFSLSGFLGKPQIGTPSKHRQFLFVNERPVMSSLFSKVLKDVFSTLLEPRSNPAFLLKLTLAPELVDVNVDPQKTKVRFVIEQEIVQQLRQQAHEVLAAANLTYMQKGANGFYDEYQMDSGIAKIVRSQGDGWNIKDAELVADTEILQVHNLYLVAQTKRGILIIDQHAAHERILYQEFLEKFESKRTESMKLQKKIIIDLPPAESEFLRTQIEVFANLGFTITQSTSNRKQTNKENSFTVTHIPRVFETRNIKRLIQEILHDCIENKNPKVIDVGTHRTISYLACRTAIKAGEKLTPKERKRLLEKLFLTQGKYTCPHGRPVEVELDITYLDQMFKRIK